MNEFIMQMRPLFGNEEREALNEYMLEDGFLTEFKNTELFEKSIKEYTGVKHCFAVNNGTIALTVAALSLGIGAGDHVIVPNFTMIATPNSVKMLGAEVSFVDVEPETLCLDIELVKAAITNKTKAIILVSANGRYPAHGIGEFEKLSANIGIPLIIDAAQSLGSTYPDGRHISCAGDVATLSFSAPKIISTGQGGAVLTNDDKIAEKISKIKDFGREFGGTDIHGSIGYNFKFTEMQAVIGLQQMRKLNSRVKRKKEIYSIYEKRLAKLQDKVELIYNDTRYTAPWFYEILTEHRTDLSNYLKTKGIGTRNMYPPINSQMAYQARGTHPVSNLVGNNGLWMPSQVQLTNDQLSYICDSIYEFFN